MTVFMWHPPVHISPSLSTVPVSACCSALERDTSNYLFLSPHPDLSVETVPGAAAVSVAVGSPAAAVSVQPGEGAAEPTAQRYAEEEEEELQLQETSPFTW